MSTKYRGSLGGLVLVLLIAIWLGCPLRAAARPAGALAPDAVVAIDPPQVAVDAQETFSVAVTIADVSELRSYEFTLTYDPAVVEVEAVERGSFLEGKSPIWLGPSIDNGTGTVTFGALSMGSAPWPSGPGELATIRLKAVGDGFTALDLQDVDLFDGGLNEIEAVVEDGQVQVGEGEVPTDTPTGEPAASDTPTATSAATATEAATSPSEATATKTPTDGATAAPGATATERPTEAERSPPGASATERPTEAATSPPGATETQPPAAGGTPGATAGATSTAQPGQTPEAAEGSPSATAEPAEARATSTDEAPGGGTPSGSTWLIVAAALLGLAGVALIGVGVFALGLRRRPGEEPMDDDS